MKKIFNWTIGSAFRTIGRFIALLLISLLFGLFLVKSDIHITDLFGFARVFADTTYSWTSKESRIYYDDGGTEKVYNYHTIPYTHTANYPITQMEYRLKYSGGLSSGNTYTFQVSYTPNPDAIYPTGLWFSDGTNLETIVNCSGWSRNSSGKYSNTCNITPVADISSSGYLYVRIVYQQAYLTSLKSEIGNFTITKGTGAIIQDSAVDIMQNNNDNTNTIIQNNNDNTNSMINSINGLGESIENITEQSTQDIINNQNENMQKDCSNLMNIPNLNLSRDGTRTYLYSHTSMLNRGTYTLSYEYEKIGSGILSIQVLASTNSGNILSQAVINENGKTTFFVNAQFDRIYFYIPTSSPSDTQVKLTNIMINKGTIANKYCSYNSKVNRIDETNDKIDQTNELLGETNNSINNLNDTLTDDNINDSDISNSLNYDVSNNAYGPFATFLTLPLQWVQDILASNQSCRPLSLPLPFVNQNLVIPCMTDFWNSTGALGTLIQLCWIAVVGVRIFNGLFKLVVDTTSSEDNAEELTKIRSWEL